MPTRISNFIKTAPEKFELLFFKIKVFLKICQHMTFSYVEIWNQNGGER
jgi:hypothetical protein